jgi:hypothetical protein
MIRQKVFSAGWMDAQYEYHREVLNALECKVAARANLQDALSLFVSVDAELQAPQLRRVPSEISGKC